MNIYFLVEGKRTEKKVYPKWLSILIPELQQVNYFSEVVENNYKLFLGCGFPHLLHKHLKNSIEEVNESGKYNYFVICLDADECSVAERVQEITDFMNSENLSLKPEISFEIIVQNRCIETWFLGNRKVFKKNPHDEFLLECVKFYNVKENDPELMGALEDFEHSQFHGEYLKHLLSERNIAYTKEHPRGVVEEPYLAELIKRIRKTNSLPTLKYFIDFCQKIRDEVLEK